MSYLIPKTKTIQNSNNNNKKLYGNIHDGHRYNYPQQNTGK